MDENGIVIRKKYDQSVPLIALIGFIIVITHLDIKTKELVEHLLYYKGTFTTYYAGHTKTGDNT